MANQSILAAKRLTDANKTQTSQGLIIQAYSNSINQQPKVDFSGTPSLKLLQGQINSGLDLAQEHANEYLNVIQPNLIQNISNIGNYYALHNAVPTTLPPGSTDQEWLSTLMALKEQAQDYESDAKNVVVSLKRLTADLSTDTRNFSEIVKNLNSAVNGDNGVMASIDNELATIQNGIDDAIGGIVMSSLSVVGGVIMIVVGAVAEFEKAGTSTALIIGGIGFLAAGVGGEVAAGITLANMNDEKAKLLAKKATLKEEVKLALGQSNAYTSFKNQADDALDASKDMSSAWAFLGDDLDTMSKDLSKGIINTGQLRNTFLTFANTQLTRVVHDIDTIKAQLSGVINVPAKHGQSLSQTLRELSQKHAA